MPIKYRVLHLSAGKWSQGTEVTEDEIRKGGFDFDDWLKLKAIEPVTLPPGTVVAVEIKPETLAVAAGNSTKRFWSCSLWLSLLATGLALEGALTQLWPIRTSLAVAALMLVSWIISINSDRLNALAQRLHRLREFKDSYGWTITAEDRADILGDLPNRVKEEAKRLKPDDTYYGSKAPPGAIRAARNLRESAYWSTRQSARMFQGSAFLSLMGVVATIIILFVALHNAGGTDLKSRDDIATFALGILTVGSNVGIWTACLRYSQFAREAKQTVTRANRLLEKGNPSVEQTVLAWGDYQLVRAGSPPLPSWLYKFLRQEIQSDYTTTYGAEE
jgi:hypothetical protein